jgi:hypothetical protein
LMDSNSIARTERNSLSFRQLVHPGCQNTFSGTEIDMVRTLTRVTAASPGLRIPSTSALRLEFVS